jgi:hypothetical protein
MSTLPDSAEEGMLGFHQLHIAVRSLHTQYIRPIVGGQDLEVSIQNLSTSLIA